MLKEVPFSRNSV